MPVASLSPHPIRRPKFARGLSGGRNHSIAAVVINTSKFEDRLGLIRFQARVDSEFSAQGWAPPVWLHTTAESRGPAEARQALAADVDVVVAAGGDGTVRAVAQELAGTSTPLAMLPLGTGNLLARNLGIPLNNVTAAVRLICQGNDKTIDVGWLEIDRPSDDSERQRYAFVVMAGAGFDAAVVAGARPASKRRWGHLAYLLSGARAMGRATTGIRVSVDDEYRSAPFSHGIIVGNCGSLTMGIPLMPAAEPYDGILDAVLLLPRLPASWVSVFWSVLSRNQRPCSSMPRLRGRTVAIQTDIPQPVQVDGDVVGYGTHVRIGVQPRALVLRCASPTSYGGPPLVPTEGQCRQQKLERARN